MPKAHGKGKFPKRRQNAPPAAVPAVLLPRADLAIHRFTRSVELGFVPSGATDGVKSFTFELSDLPAYGDFSGLFTFVRVDRLALTVSYRATKAVSAGTTVYSPVGYFVDNSMATLSTASTKDEVLQTRYKRHAFTTARPTYTCAVRPKCFYSPVGGGSLPIRAPWQLAGGSTTGSLTHWGIAVFFDDYNTTQGSQDVLDVQLSVDLSFRGQR